MSITRLSIISGCLTLIATYSPFNLALCTYAIEADAMGFSSNSSKTSVIFL